MKRMNSSTRNTLRKLAHALDPVVMVGKHGLTDQLLLKVDGALNDHELIKIRFIDYKTEKKALSLQISHKTASDIIGIVGNVLILYRQHPEEDKRRIKLPHPAY